MFKLVSPFEPKGDQPKAIEFLSKGVLSGEKHQVLLGVTGSGKTFTMAYVVERIQRPTLVIAPNKALAAQLFLEFKNLFPQNAVHYFVSYYDYYQPEAYIPQTDTYIEKDSAINDEIDKMRHAATQSLLSRPDVLIVASVSCIYGIGSPESYQSMTVDIEKGKILKRSHFLEKLVEIQYQRNDVDFHRGTFRVRGDIVDLFPTNEEARALRIEFLGDELENIYWIDPLKGEKLASLEKMTIFPGSHYVTPKENLEKAIESIKEELKERLQELKGQNKLLEAERLKTRTHFDLEMLEEMGYCNGIENYSRHLTRRKAGEPPPTLLEYFPSDFLLFIDESHVTVPQLGGMYRGDRARKTTLVEYGFRLPSALDNRPLNFEEFNTLLNQAIYVSATPSSYEFEKAKSYITEQIIRPTGLSDPEITVKPAKGQVEDLLSEIKKTLAQKERALVITLTKKMAEDLTEYYQEKGIKVAYLHSDIETLKRVEIIRDLRLGKYDVLVGINLLREGLDLPEVSLVAILDADKEGFLRSETSLIQTCGRASRNISGHVILYGDFVTKSMEKAISETSRRRKIQLDYNQKHHITPETIKKTIHETLTSIYEQDYVEVPLLKESEMTYNSIEAITKQIQKLKKQMLRHAKNLEFEEAAHLRDEVRKLQEKELELRN
ncbi:MAG: excinuclease ABC subunit B [Deltaproteobacteria bacterium GWA2_38_16]|nr:MAG: excinuclease ABC subunit B [Deltaproteobacteria bacterium GWA2_38_16]OGQ03813.1 MAG: excinuclease ABC subunit B [Deltaproteobacteria bacterium RIFCSPHIGHO2_02_FULL_38_15]OGQ59160.1 MAG: excinuclease ABC subunit B [Deltaproteobacteria bacterium RIFCSPLOWO2_12_FULL_38_8]HBQ20856.1 excinuclease ABC subunit B [Deltaproteobacteria bacterium]